MPNQTKHPNNPHFPLPPTEGQDLEALHTELGKPNEELRRLVFRNEREEDLATEGARVDSLNILSDLPRFVASALRVLAGLRSEQQSLFKLPPGLFALLVDEATTLARMKFTHDAAATASAGDKADREAVLRRVMREGVARRELLVGALGHALGSEAMRRIDVLTGDASSPDNLVKGLHALASFIDGVLKDGSPDDKAALELWDAGESAADGLRGQATLVLDASRATAPAARRTSQRALDIQDGRVLLLVDHVLRAFRLARRSDRSILLPELNRIAWMFETRSPTPKPGERPRPGGSDPGPTPG